MAGQTGPAMADLARALQLEPRHWPSITLLSAILVAMTYKVTLAGGLWFFAADGDGSGVELEVVLAAAVAALILTGPGTYSFDRRWGWSRRPAWGSAGWLIVGIGVAIAVWIIFNGANPLASWM